MVRQSEIMSHDLSITGRGNTIYLRSDGEVVPKDILDEFGKIFAKIQEGTEKDYINYSGSVGQYFTEK